MMLRSSDNTDQNNEEYHDATGLETPSRSQLPRMLSMTQVEFDERVADAIGAQSQNLTTSLTANRPNVATPNRPQRGSRTEEATPLHQTSAEVSASGLSSNSALEAILELKRQFERGKTHLDIRSLQHRRIATERSTMYLPTMLHDGLMIRNVYATSC